MIGPQSSPKSADSREAIMSVLVFSCPKTGRPIDHGIEGVENSPAAALQFAALQVRCQHCGEHHEIKVEDAALNEAA
jgi:hypothetical protein